MFPAFLFPAISALMLQRRHPELLASVPWRRWLVPLATLWVIFIVPFYVFAGLIGSMPPVSSVSIWQYASSSGLLVTGSVIVIGVLVYLVVRRYNIRRGVDVNLIWKSIPPE